MGQGRGGKLDARIGFHSLRGQQKVENIHVSQWPKHTSAHTKIAADWWLSGNSVHMLLPSMGDAEVLTQQIWGSFAQLPEKLPIAISSDGLCPNWNWTQKKALYSFMSSYLSITVFAVGLLQRDGRHCCYQKLPDNAVGIICLQIPEPEMMEIESWEQPRSWYHHCFDLTPAHAFQLTEHIKSKTSM